MSLEGQTSNFYFWPEINGQEVEVKVEAIVHSVERDVDCVTQKVESVIIEDNANLEFIKNCMDELAYGEWLMEQAGHRTTGEWHNKTDADAFKEIK